MQTFFADRFLALKDDAWPFIFINKKRLEQNNLFSKKLFWEI